jgi:hypothetical protein
MSSDVDARDQLCAGSQERNRKDCAREARRDKPLIQTENLITGARVPGIVRCESIKFGQFAYLLCSARQLTMPRK